jgi:hypothetical protein
VAFAAGVLLNWAYVKDFMLGPESRAEEPDAEERPLQRRSRVPVDREVPTPAVAGDLVAGVTPEIEPTPPRTSVPPGETRRLRIR